MDGFTVGVTEVIYEHYNTFILKYDGTQCKGTRWNEQVK